MLQTLGGDDPARELIAEILSVVPVSHWSFARFGNGGHADQLLSSEPSKDRRAELEQLHKELVLQRRQTGAGPRLAATLSHFREPYVSGVTLVFADRRREFGVLILLRSELLGAFTSVEIQALALALDSSTDRLSGLALADDLPADAAEASNPPAMHVLNRSLQVVLTWDSANGRNAAPTAIHASLATRLPTIIEQAVRDLIAEWTSDPLSQSSGVAHPVPFLTIRTQPLGGAMGLFVGVLLERTPGGEVFDRAARAYNLSPRELETLAFLMPGATLEEVAGRMHISSSTVQDHIKSMLDKTGSRNRTELIAKVLNPYPRLR